MSEKLCPLKVCSEWNRGCDGDRCEWWCECHGDDGTGKDCCAIRLIAMRPIVVHTDPVPKRRED